MSDRLENLERKLRHYPEDIDLRVHFAHALLEDGQPNRAAGQFSAVLRRNVEHKDARAQIAHLNPHAWTGWVFREPANDYFTVWEPGRTWTSHVRQTTLFGADHATPLLDWLYAGGLHLYEFDYLYDDEDSPHCIQRYTLTRGAWTNTHSHPLPPAAISEPAFYQAFSDNGNPNICYTTDSFTWGAFDGNLRKHVRRPIWRTHKDIRFEIDAEEPALHRITGNKSCKFTANFASVYWSEGDQTFIRMIDESRVLDETRSLVRWKSINPSAKTYKNRKEAQQSLLPFSVPEGSRFAKEPYLNYTTPENLAHFEHIGFEKGYEVPITVLDDLRSLYEQQERGDR